MPVLTSLSGAPHCIGRRAALGGALAGLVGAALPMPAIARPMPADVAAWNAFKERFVSGGRIIDTGNANVSHSEGQGIGLLGAALTGDRASFDRIYGWTRQTLARPYDKLHAWRYQPNAPTPVGDMNNATDGDLLITLALFTAASRWDMPAYHRAAMDLSRDIAHGLVRETRVGTYLLPGMSGFTEGDTLTINPSYYIFPALRQIALETRDPVWGRVEADGLALLHTAGFGRWKLPTDWLTLSPGGEISPAQKWPARFSFDAVRVPLYCCWSGLAHDPVVDAVQAFWSSQSKYSIPAWTDVGTGEMAPYRQTAGMAAIRAYVTASRAPGDRAAATPAMSAATDYYSAALILLVQLAIATGTAQVA